MKKSSALFPRNFRKDLPIAIRGEGGWIHTADGRRLLDASGQAAVVSIGHGVAEIGRAMAEQSSNIAFAHTSQFHSASAERLAARLLTLAPANFRDGGRVYLTWGDRRRPRRLLSWRGNIIWRRTSRDDFASCRGGRAITAA